MIQASSLQRGEGLRRAVCAQLGGAARRAGRALPPCSLAPRARATPRRSVVVEANELNKWANRDARDEDGGLPDNGFDRDTASVLLRVLTARSVQTVLMQLHETDIFVAQWLNNFAAETSPSAEGNKFLIKLFAEPGKKVTDPTTGAKHTIDPQQLAHRILQTRDEMVRNVVGGSFLAFAAEQTTHVMRQHLMKSYTSGSTEEGYKERRPYYRPRSGPRR